MCLICKNKRGLVLLLLDLCNVLCGDVAGEKGVVDGD